ncbi:MAG: neutral/alkaline non-lysosomal ceramidase N-terminal domain-containing protein [Elusimicrobiota bacterium]
MLSLFFAAAPGHTAAPAPAAEGKLYAAAGKVDITPDLKNERTWLAGFGAMGRRPAGVHDPLYARALVLSDGERTVAFAVVDAVGIFREDVAEVRRRLGWDGVKKYLFLSATHTHSGPDTSGLWGRWPAVSGVNESYRQRTLDALVGLVQGLAAELKEAEMSAVRRDLDPRGLCADSRDPVVIDPELDAVQVRAKAGGAVIGTLVRWSCHPEVIGRKNLLISADYPGALCAKIEDQTGGACIFQTGIIGGLMTPDIADGLSVAEEYGEMKRIGEAVADAALGALKDAPRVSRAAIAFKTKTVRLPVQNSRYLLFLPNLAFGHRIFDRDGRIVGRGARWGLALRHLFFFPLAERLRPWVETEVSHVRVGALEFLGIPGELFPELAIGGYDGRYRFGHDLTRPTNPNPPRLTAAPKGPYLRDKIKADVGVLVGLANDEVGYLMPDYDFQARPSRSMEPRMPGTHYEETNSIGPAASGLLLKAYDELLAP